MVYFYMIKKNLGFSAPDNKDLTTIHDAVIDTLKNLEDSYNKKNKSENTFEDQINQKFPGVKNIDLVSRISCNQLLQLIHETVKKNKNLISIDNMKKLDPLNALTKKLLFNANIQIHTKNANIKPTQNKKKKKKKKNTNNQYLDNNSTIKDFIETLETLLELLNLPTLEGYLKNFKTNQKRNL